MFSNPTKPNSSVDEATVLQVDPVSKTCKIQTLRGQNFDMVQWTETVGNSSRGGDRAGPMMGDRVVVMYGLGYPLIFGFLPKLQSSENAFPLNINSSQAAVNTGDYSNSDGVIVGDANKPSDIVNGDRVLGSEGGSLIALLRAGGVVIKSSSLSQIFLSKIDDVVKIISRNWEHYTDVGSDIVKNFKGRVYRYVGYSNTFAKTKIEDYNYHQYFGDTAAAEAVKTDYLTPPATVPDTNNILFKEQITATGAEKMYRTVNDAGEVETKIIGSGMTRVRQTGGVVTVSYNDQNTITVNDAVIELQRSDGATVILDANGIHASFSGGTVDMKTTGISSAFSGGLVELKSSGISTSFGGGVVELKSTGVYNTFGGHFVNVTSGGVQLG